MKAKIMTEGEITPLCISSLPTRPTAPLAFGGKGYTAKEMKAAFDKLPLLIAERLNALIDDVLSGALAESLTVSTEESLTLARLFDDVKDGSLASYLAVGDTSLTGTLTLLSDRIAALEEKLLGREDG